MEEKEIERRWVLEKLPDAKLFEWSIRRTVGYLFTDGGELRVVNKKKPDNNTYYLTVKSDGKLVRDEWQVKIPQWALDILWPKTENCRLEITRHACIYKLNTTVYDLEFDEYHGKLNGLYKMECEFKSVAEANNFNFPKFVGKSN